MLVVIGGNVLIGSLEIEALSGTLVVEREEITVKLTAREKPEDWEEIRWPHTGEGDTRSF